MTSTVPEDPFGSIKKPASNTVAPSPQEVNNFHARADTDSGDGAIHHTLGLKHNQASPGDHKHDGKNSKLILEGKVLTGSKGGNVALANLITMLSTAFGFQDSTT